MDRLKNSFNFLVINDLPFEVLLRRNPIGVTATHPFWSCDRNEWVSAIDLRIGEKLKTRTGTTVVESRNKREEPEAVHNIEVEGDHVYRVGESGVLVHNTSPSNPCNPPGGDVRSTGVTNNLTVSWFNGNVSRPDGAVALVTPDSTGSSPTRVVVPTHVHIVATSQQDPSFRIDVNIPNTSTATQQC